VSKADAAAYLTKARNWLDAAQDNLLADRWDVAAGSAVTAGINACDSICGYLLGERSGGQHDEAVGLLASAGEDGRAASRQLAQLLRFKTRHNMTQHPCPRPTRARQQISLNGWSTEPRRSRANASGRHGWSLSALKDLLEPGEVGRHGVAVRFELRVGHAWAAA
jgi:hypothetical protein